MPQRQQPIKRVLRIEVIIRPVPVKAAFGIPQGIDEIEAELALTRGEATLQRGKSMQRGSGGEQIGKWGFRDREEATLRMRLGQQPIRRAGAHRHLELMEYGDGGSGGWRRAHGKPA